MKKLIEKYKEIITYVIFGVLTTVVNFVVFRLCEILLGERLYLLSNIIAWAVSVAFAYITNKIWVFESKSFKPGVVIKEVCSFAAARLFSLGVEEGGLVLFVELLGFGKISLTLLGFTITGQLISKAILAVIVVILNYFFSKYVIFKKKKGSNDERVG